MTIQAPDGGLRRTKAFYGLFAFQKKDFGNAKMRKGIVY